MGVTRVNLKHSSARAVQWLLTAILFLTALKFFHLQIIASEMSLMAEDPEIFQNKANEYTKLSILFLLLAVLAFSGLGYLFRRSRHQTIRP